MQAEFPGWSQLFAPLLSQKWCGLQDGKPAVSSGDGCETGGHFGGPVSPVAPYPLRCATGVGAQGKSPVHNVCDGAGAHGQRFTFEGENIA